ncbi:dUTPase [Staphylococcus sp. HMSC057G10]|uniref:dUTPase n=1 Tax=Staphylococcus TaxID=1279 RepID=UPI0008A99C3F|nr:MULTISPECIES: dUTPase [Staphylococcus]OHO94489.1 dUTPase [Staphylococcus sp. HMSC057G10]
MTNTLTVDQLQELLKIQKEFDDRIPTLNLHDSKIAYVVEFFEWFNTLETFKNWKKKPGKPLDVQLDELADMLAFGLSIFSQTKDADEIESELQKVVTHVKYFTSNVEGLESTEIIDYISVADFNGKQLRVALLIADYYYSIDQLITAYKKKMERNHARQNGTADKGKGYV